MIYMEYEIEHNREEVYVFQQALWSDTEICNLEFKVRSVNKCLYIFVP